MKKPHIAIFGSTGFIGRHLLLNALSKKNSFRTITLPVRDTKKLDSLDEQINPIKCDHLDIKKMKFVLRTVDVIYDMAGLAWQHPGKTNFSQLDLLIEQLLQNSLSAYFIGLVLKKDQILVWTSTSAIDSMLNALTRIQRMMLEEETESFIECLFVQKNLYNASISSLKNIVWKLVVKHILYSFSFALEFSYAYSKYIGQKILQRLSQENIRILKISDVYGPGQSITSDLIKGNIPARRIQRFVALHKLIKEGDTHWILLKKNKIHGFYKTITGKIIEEAWNDFLFPTYIDDVIFMLKQAGDPKRKLKIVLQVNGNKISNKKMIETIRSFFKTNVVIKLKNHSKVNLTTHKDDLQTLGISRKSLIDFGTGLRKWLSEV